MRPSAAYNGRQVTSEYILYDANAGYQQTLLPVVTRPAKKTGLRPHRHHQHRRTGGSEPMERHETPDPRPSIAVKPRIQCVRVRAQARAHSRTGRAQLAPTRVSSRCSGQLAGGLASAHASGLAFATASGQAPGQAEHRQRSGKTPQTAKKPGLGAGPGHPEPRRERRDISRPFSNDHAC
jgi:hypothetical protein